MKFFAWRLSLDDLPNRLGTKVSEPAIIDLRRNVRIAVIDDKEFTPQHNLSNNNYIISHFADITNIQEIAAFPIVLVDLLGVGGALNPTLQGAHLISEITKNYPDKVVIAYTGGAEDKLLVPAIEFADYFIKKDASIEKWCTILDRAIDDITNPIVVWQRVRHELLEKGATPNDLVVIEDRFVRSFSDGKFNIDRLESDIDRLELKDDTRAVMQSVIGSAVFQLFVSVFG